MKQSRGQAYIIIIIAALFYLYEFFIRVSPSVITNELMRDFHIHAGELGFLSSLFYYSYSAMQIPAGLLGDKYGPKKVLTIAACICSGSLFILAYSKSANMIGVSRFLTGMACSFGYIGPLMLARSWFPKERFALITGIIQTLGCLGATIGTGPISYLTTAYGWRMVVWVSALFGVVLALLFLLIVRDHPSTATYKKSEPPPLSEYQRIRHVVKQPQTWITGIIGFCFWSPIAVFAELWGVPFLMELHHTDAANVSPYIMWVWLGIAIGAPLIGWYSNYSASRKKPIMLGFFFGLIASIGIVFWHPESALPMDILMVLFGISASTMVITFGVVTDNNPLSVSGTAIGFNNMAVILGATILQPITGYLLNYFWDGKILDGYPIYGLDGYIIGFSILPLFSLIGMLFCYYGLKETHCKKQYHVAK